MINKYKNMIVENSSLYGHLYKPYEQYRKTLPFCRFFQTTNVWNSQLITSVIDKFPEIGKKPIHVQSDCNPECAITLYKLLMKPISYRHLAIDYKSVQLMDSFVNNIYHLIPGSTGTNWLKISSDRFYKKMLEEHCHTESIDDYTTYLTTNQCMKIRLNEYDLKFLSLSTQHHTIDFHEFSYFLGLLTHYLKIHKSNGLDSYVEKVKRVKKMFYDDIRMLYNYMSENNIHAYNIFQHNLNFNGSFFIYIPDYLGNSTIKKNELLIPIDYPFEYTSNRISDYTNIKNMWNSYLYNSDIVVINNMVEQCPFIAKLMNKWWNHAIVNYKYNRYLNTYTSYLVSIMKFLQKIDTTHSRSYIIVKNTSVKYEDEPIDTVTHVCEIIENYTPHSVVGLYDLGKTHKNQRSPYILIATSS